MALVALCLGSVLTLYYQWENWRSAKELAAARQRVIARLGTEDPDHLLPHAVPDEQNFFAQPAVQQWAGQLPGHKFKSHYNIPKRAFLPKDFVRPDYAVHMQGIVELDYKEWAEQCKKAGKPLSADVSSEVAMDRQLGDGNGLLPRLAAELHRPASCFKPNVMEAIEAAGGDYFKSEKPEISRFSGMDDLGLHVSAAAHAGNKDKVLPAALILLRLFPESAMTHGTVTDILSGLSAHGMAFAVLRDALARPVWSAEGLRQMQFQLARIDDLKSMEKARMHEMLRSYAMFMKAREVRAHFGLDDFAGHLVKSENTTYEHWWMRGVAWGYGQMVRFGPLGWQDANTASYLNQVLDLEGPATETGWVGQAARSAAKSSSYTYHYSPRALFADLMIPSMMNLGQAAAEILFQRRCLIIACSVERYRLQHGRWPVSLDALRDDLAPFQIGDPAQAGKPMSGRVAANKLSLWSAGSDGKDDGGAAASDWVWHLEFKH